MIQDVSNKMDKFEIALNFAERIEEQSIWSIKNIYEPIMYNKPKNLKIQIFKTLGGVLSNSLKAELKFAHEILTLKSYLRQVIGKLLGYCIVVYNLKKFIQLLFF